MLGLGVSRDAFVATATATGLIVDAARMPVYVASAWPDLIRLWQEILGASVAVLLGTWLGMRILRRIPEPVFRRLVSALLVALGVWLLAKG